MSFVDSVISSEQLRGVLEDPAVRVVDCRYYLKDPELGRTEYSASHIPGAVYAHLDEDLSSEIIPGVTGRHPLPSVDSFVGKLESWGISNDNLVVVYDQSHSAIAARLWWMLKWLGHDRVGVLDGGWQQWQSCGYEVEHRHVNYTPTKFEVKLRNWMVIDADEAHKMALDVDQMLIDSRGHSRYLGHHEPIDPVAGHIPGAVNLPFIGNVNDEMMWKSLDEVRDRFIRIGAEVGSNTAFYCGSGVTACQNILAMERIGFGLAKLYPGSWSHWITEEDRPVATDSQ